jgi:Transglutaminase-like superfamily
MHSQAKLRLAPHVRACRCDGQVILLDMKRNKYLGVGGRQLSALEGVVAGWPACNPREARPAEEFDVGSLAAPLIKQGLLTSGSQEAVLGLSTEQAASSLNADDGVRVATGFVRTYRFLRSAAVVSLWLRFRSLHAISKAVANIRAGVEPHDQLGGRDALREAVGAYLKLRPLVFTAQDRCLFDSLALVHFLAGESIPSTWVVGVKTNPFGAHSWAQSGDLVLNDQHEHVRRFQPIVAV